MTIWQDLSWFSLAYALPEDHKSGMSLRSTVTNLMKQLHTKTTTKWSTKTFQA
ncbi:hypothetical protein ERO13_A11G320632v2 [Gossypium hirsutum]|nr:hypothetical protein ERO13_A11G320632v2 [Gossypium hirsutum]